MTHYIIEVVYYDREGNLCNQKEYVEGCTVEDIMEAYAHDGCEVVSWSWWQ